jgi:hypothetical protein
MAVVVWLKQEKTRVQYDDRDTCSKVLCTYMYSKYLRSESQRRRTPSQVGKCISKASSTLSFFPFVDDLKDDMSDPKT